MRSLGLARLLAALPIQRGLVAGGWLLWLKRIEVHQKAAFAVPSDGTTNERLRSSVVFEICGRLIDLMSRNVPV